MSSKLVSWIHKPVAVGGKGIAGWDDDVKKGIDWADDVSALTNPTFSKPGFGSFKGGGFLGGAALGGALDDELEDVVNVLPIPKGKKTPANSPVQTCRPLNCYESCKLKDKKKLQQCRALNAKFTEEMAKLGCPGTKCRTPAFAKSCR